MRYQVVFLPGEDGWIIAECPSLPGCISQGRTQAEALANIRAAMELWLEVSAEDGKGAPPPREITLADVEVETAA